MDQTLVDFIAHKDYESAETWWGEAAATGGGDADTFLELGSALLEAKQYIPVADLVAKTLPRMRTEANWTAVRHLSLLGLRAMPARGEFASAYFEAVAREFPDRVYIPDWLDRARDEAKGEPFRTIEKLEAYLSTAPGQHFFHRSGWGMGRVRAIDPATGMIEIDFAEKPGHRMPVNGIHGLLQPVPGDHFLVRVAFDLDALKAEAKEDALGVIKTFLRDRPNQTADLKEIKKFFIGPVVTKTEWTSWWGSARKKAKEDPYVAISSGTNPKLELRNAEVNPAQELVDSIKPIFLPVRTLTMIREFINDVRGEEKRPPMEPVRDFLLKRFVEPPPDYLDRVVLHFVTEDLEAVLGHEGEPLATRFPFDDTFEADPPDAKPKEKDAAKGTTWKRLVRVFRELPSLDYKRRFASQLRKSLPDSWHNRFAILFRSGTYDSLDLVARTLKEEGHEDLLTELVTDIAEDAANNTETFFWIARSRLTDRSLCPDPGLSGLELFNRFLKCAEVVYDRLSNPKAAGTRDADKTLIQRYRAFLADKEYAALWTLMDAHSPDDRRLIYSRTLKNRALGEFFKSAFDARAADRYEGIAAKQETVESLIPTGTIYGTAVGRIKKEEEVRRLREVELPRVAEALAAAKAQGDLSENAEHDAALEKKQEIDGRLAMAGAQLQQFKEINRQMFTPEMVFVGSRVTLLNLENNQNETVSILGPWDVDVEHGIISYESEKGAILIGKNVGQHVHLDLPSKSFDWEVVANNWYEDAESKTA